MRELSENPFINRKLNIPGPRTMTEPAMIETWIEAVCNAAGWTLPNRNRYGVFRFRLADNVHVDVSSPDPREILLEADITALPGIGKAAVLERAARAVLPRVFKDSGVVCLDRGANALVLQQKVILGVLRYADFPGIMERFLNGLYFYRSILGKA